MASGLVAGMLKAVLQSLSHKAERSDGPAAWLADLNMWALWDVRVREPWIGVTLTGLVLAGVAYFWTEILGFFRGLERKYNDEAAAIEKDRGLRQVA